MSPRKRAVANSSSAHGFFWITEVFFRLRRIRRTMSEGLQENPNSEDLPPDQSDNPVASGGGDLDDQH